MTRFNAVTSPEVSEREVKNRDLSRRIAAEGMVLLENNGILPLDLEGKKIALFGNGARHTVQGGTGSGEVNTRTVSTVEEGLENAGAQIITKAWLDRYDAAASEAKGKYLEKLKQKYSDSPEMAFWAMFSYRNPLTVPLEEEDLLPPEEVTACLCVGKEFRRRLRQKKCSRRLSAPSGRERLSVFPVPAL